MNKGKLAAALTGVIKRGEIWKVSHARKGDFTVKFLKDVNLDTDWSADVRIVAGRAKFISEEDRVVGDDLTLSKSLTTLIAEVTGED